MKEENIAYITGLSVKDVPWNRLTTAYSRGTDFPEHLEKLFKMSNQEEVKESLGFLFMNMEHQSTLWHATPFAMIFLCRILEHALSESKNKEVARFLTEELLDFILCVLQCFHDCNEIEHPEPLPLFVDMLDEKFLWSEEYDEVADLMRYEDDEVFPGDLFYSFYFYSWQAILAYKNVFVKDVPEEFAPKIAVILEAL